MVGTLNLPAIAGSLGQDYCYKPRVTQIPHDAGLALTHPARNLSRKAACKAVTLPLQHSVRHYGGVYMFMCVHIFFCQEN